MKQLSKITILLCIISCQTNHSSVKSNSHKSINIQVKTEIKIDRATTYNPEKNQCDSDPLITADNSFIDIDLLKSGVLRWVALSRDLLSRWGGRFNYGDTINVSSISKPQINGDWVVHDCMNARYRNSLDFLFYPSDDLPKFGVCEDLIINN